MKVNLSDLKQSISVRLEESVPDFRISRIADVALKALIVALAATTVALGVAAIVLTSLALTNAMGVTIIALAVLLGVVFFREAYPVMPDKMKHVADYIKSIVLDIFAAIAMGLSFPATLFMKEPYDEKSDQQPILLVHGYLSHRAHWWYIRMRLRMAGHRQVYTVNLGTPFNSIEDFVAVVDRKVQEIQRKTGKMKIKIIGHSMGGLVASHFAHQTESTVTHIITLGSPLQGTHLAPIGVGQCTHQMCRESDYIGELNGKIDKLKQNGTKFHHIGSNADIIIRPNCSAYVGDEQNHHEFCGLGHISYLFSDRVADKVIEVLHSFDSGQSENV